MSVKYFQAAILEKLNEPLAIRTLEIPQHLSVGQVLVKILYSGICGSQLNEIAGVKGPDKYLPHLLGHEAGAVIVAIGPGVKNLRIGNHVVVHWRKGAGIDSESPQYWCPELGRYIGAGSNNTFQEYSIVSENRLTKIPAIPLDEAALLGCAIGTGIGAVTNDVNLKPGQSAIVFGCGGVGLNVIQGCALVNACPIVAVDITDDKLSRAMAMGATSVIRSSHAFFSTTEYDAAFDTTGNPEVIELAWRIAKKVCLIAQVRHDRHISLQTLPMHRGKTIFGSDGGMTDPSNDIPRYIKLLEAGKLNLRDLITHRSNLAGINGLLDLIRAGKTSRCVIEM